MIAKLEASSETVTEATKKEAADAFEAAKKALTDLPLAEANVASAKVLSDIAAALAKRDTDVKAYAKATRECIETPILYFMDSIKIA